MSFFDAISLRKNSGMQRIKELPWTQERHIKDKLEKYFPLSNFTSAISARYCKYFCTFMYKIIRKNVIKSQDFTLEYYTMSSFSNHYTSEIKYSISNFMWCRPILYAPKTNDCIIDQPHVTRLQNLKYILLNLIVQGGISPLLHSCLEIIEITKSCKWRDYKF